MHSWEIVTSKNINIIRKENIMHMHIAQSTKHISYASLIGDLQVCD